MSIFTDILNPLQLGKDVGNALTQGGGGNPPATTPPAQPPTTPPTEPWFKTITQTQIGIGGAALGGVAGALIGGKNHRVLGGVGGAAIGVGLSLGIAALLGGTAK